MMFQINAIVVKKEILTDNIILLTFESKELSRNAQPGQFVNIRISESCYPYLRRPFSYCDVDGDFFKIMFTVFGSGTKILAESKIGDKFDVLGPLGNGFSLNPNQKNVVFVGGGLGIAPFPFLFKALKERVHITTYIGARNKDFVVTYGLENYRIATDDGSAGYHGNIVELLRQDFENQKFGNDLKIYGCGPTPMLKSLKQFCEEYNLECEISTESAMACGFGICQGCPIETSDSSGYKLVCKDGPVFNIRDIKL